jgi:hypothetical protein
MRSSVAAGMMGIGAIFGAFALSIFLIGLFVDRTSSSAQFATMVSLGTATAVGGAVLFALGYLLGRRRREAGQSTDSRPRSV